MLAPDSISVGLNEASLRKYLLNIYKQLFKYKVVINKVVSNFQDQVGQRDLEYYFNHITDSIKFNNLSSLQISARTKMDFIHLQKVQEYTEKPLDQTIKRLQEKLENVSYLFECIEEKFTVYDSKLRDIELMQLKYIQKDYYEAD